MCLLRKLRCVSMPLAAKKTKGHGMWHGKIRATATEEIGKRYNRISGIPFSNRHFTRMILCKRGPFEVLLQLNLIEWLNGFLSMPKLYQFVVCLIPQQVSQFQINLALNSSYTVCSSNCHWAKVALQIYEVLDNS